MKIIGRAGDGYIVVMGEDELACILGCGSQYTSAWELLKKQHTKYGERGLCIGTDLLPLDLNRWHMNIRSNEEGAIKAAGMLRSLADMITVSLPTVIIPPVETEGASQ